MLIDICPDRQQLREFVTGRLPGDSLDAIAEHLETCEECDASVVTLDNESDSFINELKFPAGDDSFLNEREFHQAVSAVQAFENDSPLPLRKPSRNQHVGQYMLVERLGTGGMGTVYKALHTKLEKFVALKILRTKRMLDGRAIARFEREIKAVGQLKHENIVQASDAGDVDGKQYLVMEYIVGAEFSELIARNERLSIDDACELVRQAAVGLQHAHEHGLVHRDMKPSNLMLSEDGSVKILDLGLAGFAGDQFSSARSCEGHTECDDLTLDGQIMGTAEYIAPEQAKNSHDVDIRADIYGLGCTLYSLIVGVPPFRREDFATPKQLLDAHQTSDRPSIANLSPALARILDRMLAIDPADRFSTPAEVAHAIRPFTINANVAALLSSKPKPAAESAARKDAKSVDVWRWHTVLHKKLLFALATLAVVAAVVGFAAFGDVFRLNTPYGTVEIETDDKNVDITVSQGGKEIEIINAASGWHVRLKEGEYDLTLNSGDDKFKLSDDRVIVSRDNKVVLRVTLKNKPRVVPSDPLDGNVALSSRGATVAGPANYPQALLDGKTTGYHGTRGWAQSETPATWTVTLPRDYPLQQIRLLLYDRDSRAFRYTMETSADGKKFEMVADHSEKWSRSWQILPCPGRPVRHIRVQCLDSTYNNRLRERGFFAIELEAYCRPPKPRAPIGDGFLEGNVKNLDLKGNPLVASLVIKRLRHIGVTITEKNGVATGFNFGNSPLITDDDLAMLESLSSLENFTLVRCVNVTDAGFAHLKHLPRLQRLNLSPSNITDAGLANLKGMKDLSMLSLNSPAITDAGVTHLTQLPSLKELILSNTQTTAAGLNRLATLKNLELLQLVNTQITPTAVEELRDLLPDNCEIKCTFAPPQQPLSVGASVGASKPTTLPGHENHVNSVAYSPDGKTLAAGDAAGKVILWDLVSKKKLRSLNNVQVIQCVDFSPDGKTLVTADRGAAVTFWDVESGREIKRLEEHTSAVMSVTYSPEGEMLASAGVDKVVNIWDSESGKVRATLSGHTNAIQEVKFSRDGKKLASIDLDGVLRIWDPVAGELLKTHQVDRSGMGLAFSPDGKLLAAANYPPKIQLLDAATGRVLRTLLGHKSRVRDVVFSRNGRVLASAGDDQTIRLWDVASGRQIGLFTGHTDRVHDVEFSPDGKNLASGSADTTSRVWNISD